MVLRAMLSKSKQVPTMPSDSESYASASLRPLNTSEQVKKSFDYPTVSVLQTSDIEEHTHN